MTLGVHRKTNFSQVATMFGDGTEYSKIKQLKTKIV